jgi:hypothetical protein
LSVLIIVIPIVIIIVFYLPQDIALSRFLHNAVKVFLQQEPLSAQRLRRLSHGLHVAAVITIAFLE